VTHLPGTRLPGFRPGLTADSVDRAAEYNDNTGKEWTGDWPNTKPRYLGLKLIKGGGVYYGWAHVHVDTTKLYGAVRLRESSYNPHADQPIRAGHRP